MTVVFCKFNMKWPCQRRLFEIVAQLSLQGMNV